MNKGHRLTRRILAVSDIHADYERNVAWIRALSPFDYHNDVLLLGGDVTSNLARLRMVLECLKTKFAEVFFVPGNHELWVRENECKDSMEKFSQVLNLCSSLAVRTNPAKINIAAGGAGVWIVPLFSWYRKPEEGEKSLFVVKENEAASLNIWADDLFTRWNASLAPETIADAFLRINKDNLHRKYDAPIISFSHFLPRRELIFCAPHEGGLKRERRSVPDANPNFNFSRVAGCSGLEEQIRMLGSVVHVYGHQHRNRDREIEGVRYISHCLGYPQERETGHIHGVEQGPLQIWPPIDQPNTG